MYYSNGILNTKEPAENHIVINPLKSKRADKSLQHFSIFEEQELLIKTIITTNKGAH